MMGITHTHENPLKEQFYSICCDHRFSTSMSTANPWLAHCFFFFMHIQKEAEEEVEYICVLFDSVVLLHSTLFGLEMHSVKTFKFHLFSFHRLQSIHLYIYFIYKFIYIQLSSQIYFYSEFLCCFFPQFNTL